MVHRIRWSVISYNHNKFQVIIPETFLLQMHLLFVRFFRFLQEMKKGQISPIFSLPLFLFISFVSLEIENAKKYEFILYISFSGPRILLFCPFFSIMRKSRIRIYFYQPGKNGKCGCSEKKILFPFYKSFCYSKILYSAWEKRRYKFLNFILVYSIILLSISASFLTPDY